MMKRTDDVNHTLAQTGQDVTGGASPRAPRPAPLALIRLALLLLLPALLWLATPQGASAQSPVYVDKDATSGANNGASWADAYTTLQAALDVANANAGTNYEIWVAEGTYYPDEGGSHVANSRTESFRITNNNVQFYGGFGGDETERTQRDWRAHPTILSGDIDQDGALTNNAYHVLYLDGVTDPNITAATVIDGFTITGGNAVGGSPSHGGGLYCAGNDSGNECSPTIGNIAFSGNQAGYGGAMYNNGSTSGMSSPSLVNVLFSGNQVIYGGDGGAVYNNGSSSGTSSPSMTNVTFSGNRGGYSGGAMFNDGYSGTSSPSLVNVTFSGNRADYTGGALYNTGGSSGKSSPSLVNVIMWGNAAGSGTQIGNYYATPSISYSLVPSTTTNIYNAFSTITWGPGNITAADANPLFVTPISATSAPTTTGNYRLQGGSPAIDAGNNLSVTVATDLDGNPRIANGVVDMGAYELAILYVDTERLDGAHTGLSWTDAFTNMQDALGVANANAGTRYEIWVAEGTYYPDEGADAIDNSRTMSFTLRYDNVQLYGGFAATETLRTQRDWRAHPTILSGDIDQDGALTNNAYHVLYLDGVTDPNITAATMIDGFTVTGGNANGADPHNNGGGLLCYGHDSGRACSPTLTNIAFIGNAAQSGGGGCFDGTNGQSSPTLTDVTFRGNQASDTGGGMSIECMAGTCTPQLTNVLFTGNKSISGGGGGMYLYDADSATLTNVTFSGNSAADYKGGGLHFYRDSFETTAPLTITNSIFWGNSPQNLFSSFRVSVVAAYSDIDQNGYTGNNNIRQDPRFVAPIAASSAPTTTGDYRLQTGSPAIDAGNNLSVTVATDLDGNPRIVNGVVDMGAYEKLPEPALSLTKQVTPTTDVAYQGVVTYTLVLSNSGGAADGAAILTDTLPAQVAFGGWVANPGAEQAGNVITWSGAITPATALTYVFTATHMAEGFNQVITNTATYSGSLQTGSAAAAFAQMRLIYVDRDAPGLTPDGLAWTTAYTNVQDALGVANANAGARYEIWVAEGTYYPDEGAGAIDNSRTESFHLTNDNVQLYGGFAATETLRTQRNWGSHPTILSGDINGDGALSGNAFHVFYLDGETDPNITAATVIDGLTVTGGNAETYPNYNGGGLYCAGNGSGNACSPTIANVAFNGNRANMYGGAMYNGGASGGTSSPTLTNVTYSGNWAYSGGAMCNWGESGDSSPTLMNVVFAGNSAEEGGGAISNDGQGGRSSPTLTNVTISGNYGGTNGGGMYNYAPSGTSVPRLTNVILWGNWARFGPQIDGLGATATISYSLVQGGYTGVGNFDLDPQFVVPITATVAPTTTGNYRLQTGSPAIDAGNNGAVLAGVDTDLDGNPRIVNGVVDMGAYEKQPGPALGMSKQVTPATNVAYQGVVTYTLTLSNSGNLTDTVALTDALPAQVVFGGWVESQGAEQAGNVITWSGPITPATALTFVFTATHSAGVGVIINTATFSGSLQAGSADAAFTALCSPAITVQNAADSGAGSLRQAIADVCPGGVVDFNLSYPATITLTSAQLTVGKDMTIAGPGAANLAVSGANARRVFSITTGVNVTLDGLTIRDGNAGSGNGGGIYNSGVLTLTHSSVLSSTARDGGGMYNDRTSPMVGSVIFSGNLAGNDGGGVYNNGYAGASSPSLVNVTFSGNQAARDGGAMINNGNEYGASSPSLVNVTFSGNQAARYGGAMINAGAYGGTSGPNLVNVIMWGNTATIGYQIHNISASPVISFSTIEGGCPAGATCNSEMSYVDPLFVAPIAASSAPTTTGDYRLRACSPAIDVGDNASVTVAADLDGNPRIVNSVVDMGAYEAALMPCLHLAKAVAPTTNVAYQSVVTYTLILSNSGVLTGTAALTDALPAEVAFGGWVESHGAEQAGNVITWSGEIEPATVLTFVFTATHTSQTLSQVITNTATYSGARQTGSAATAFAQVRLIYVDRDAPGPAHDGLAWTTAYTNVQDALGVANANAGTRYEIWVAEGTYYPDEGAGAIDNSRTMSFTLRYDNVQIYGGFAATETLRTQRNWIAHPTILSGDIDADGTLTGNAYHVLYLDGVTDPNITTATVIDGFTVTAGYANGSTPNDRGGGLSCDGSDNGNACSPMLANVTFAGNQAMYGGAMYNNGSYGTSSPNLVNIIFGGNRADFGGAMYNAGASGTSSPSLVNVTFSGNQAVWRGGAMYNVGGSDGVSSPRLVNVIFSANQADHDGGAMYNIGLAGTSSPSLDNVTFIGNQAADSGGAMYNKSVIGICNPVLTNVTFSGNRAAKFGGAMYNVGTDSTCSLTNVILWGNTAITGTQVANIDATLSIRNTLIPSTTGDIHSTSSSTITWGAGNLTNADAAPLFVAPVAASSAPTTTGDYRLRACSPAIDAGDDASVTVATDLDGNPRIQGFGVDMGAYETALMPCLAAAKQVTPTANVPYQGVVTYTLTLSNSGNLTDTAALTDALPAQVAFGGWVESQGAEQANNVITWSGEMTPAAALTYVFTATHTGAANVTVTNTAEFSGALQAGQASATFATVKANTTTVLTSTPNPSSYREQIAFTVTVSAPGGGTPAGVVTFTTTTGELGVRSLTDGVATFETAVLAVGTHVITATYGGDGNYQVSAATPVTQTVNRANTTTALTSAPNASAFGQAVTFTATVTVNAPGAGAPTGVVTFTTASGDLGAGNLADGAATVSTSSLGIGSHIITATYGGDGNFADSSASLTQVVARSATAVDFTPAPNPAQYGEMVRTAITVTARHILPAGELSVQRPLGPGGVVTLYDGVDAVTTAVVVDGVATVAWPLPATGAHTLTVIYSGDAFHAAGVSAPGTLLVAKTATTSTLAAPPAATLYGAPAPFTVTVQSALVQSASNAPPTPARPTGQVQIQAGDAVLGVGVLVEGVAVIDVGLLAGGIRTLTAAYAGDANYLASTAAAIQHTVLPAPAQTSLVAAPNPAAIHTPVTFTATVQAAPLIPDGLTTQVGLATPTGQVIFQSGATVLGSSALANGVATVTTDALAFGDHAITAHYSGDANYQAAVSAVVTQSITAPTPLAVNDAAGVLEGEAVTIAVLANDHDPAGGGLTVVAVTQPAHGAASIDPGGATVHYAAAAGVGGVDSFTYTLQDVHGQQSTATVAVVVTVLTETDAPPQVAVLDPAVQSTTHFTSSQATVAVDAPTGVYTGTLTPAQIFFLSYTPIVTPTAHTLTPPGTLQFGNFEFELTAFRDDQPLHGLVFAQPVVLAIHYNPALLSSLEPATLGLYFWDGTGWSTDGIVILNHDLATATLTVSLAHLSKFAFFAAAVPTDLEPAPEPNVTPKLYLPAVMSEASSVTILTSGVTDNESQVTDDEPHLMDEEPAVLPSVLYLPAVRR